MYNLMDMFCIKILVKYWVNKHYNIYIAPGRISADTNLQPDQQLQVDYLWAKVLVLVYKIMLNLCIHNMSWGFYYCFFIGI